MRKVVTRLREGDAPAEPRIHQPPRISRHALASGVIASGQRREARRRGWVMPTFENTEAQRPQRKNRRNKWSYSRVVSKRQIYAENRDLKKRFRIDATVRDSIRGSFCSPVEPSSNHSHHSYFESHPAPQGDGMPKLMQHDYGNLQNLLDIAEETKEWFNLRIKLFANATQGHVFHGGASTKREKFAHEVKDHSGKRVQISRSKQLSRNKGQKNLGMSRKGGLRAGLDDKVVPSARAKQKAVEKGDYRYIKDVIRASVVYEDCAGAIQALQMLRRDGVGNNNRFFKPVEVKNNTESFKAAGYADINIIVVCPENQHLCELQLHFESMMNKKSHGGHQAYNIEREALKGKSLSQVNHENPHMRQATSFGGGWVQNKNVALAKRARMNGRAVYGSAIQSLLTDPDYNRMQQRVRALVALAKQNAAEFMAGVAARDAEIAQGLIDPEYDFDF